MITRTLFRALIVISLVTGALGVVVEVLWVEPLPDHIQLYIDEHYPSPVFETLAAQPEWVWWAFGIGLIGLMLTISAGLMCFQAWARTLWLWTAGLGIVVLPFTGPEIVLSGWTQLLWFVSGTLDVAVITLSYYSSIHSEFDRSAADA